MLSICADTIAASAEWKARAPSSAFVKIKLAPSHASFRKGNRFIKNPLPPLQAMEIAMSGEFTGLILFLWIVTAPILVAWLISNRADRRPSGYYKRNERGSGADPEA